MSAADVRLMTEATGQRIAQAVENLINPGESEVIAYPDSVRYGYAQTLTDAQKQQAQQNIGVTSSIIVEQITTPASIMSFPDGAAVNARDLVVGIEPVQSGSGDPSPTNVRPITGWTGANVTRTGKNLLKTSNVTEQGKTFVVDENGWISAEDTSSDSRFWNYESCQWYLTLQKGTYALKVEADDTWGTQTNRGLMVLTEQSQLVYTNSAGSFAFDLSEQTTIGIMAKLYAGKLRLQIELGSTAPAYEPYTGMTIPISWQSEAGTVYGGTLDVTTGLLTVTMAEVDLGTLTWLYDSGDHSMMRASLNDGKRPSADTDIANILCSQYRTDSVSNIYNHIHDKSIGILNSNNFIWVYDSAYSNPNEFQAAMSDVQLVYELATPQTYQLTPTQVALLLGQNNIWADTGDVQSVEYQADTKLYIDKKIAALGA